MTRDEAKKAALDWYAERYGRPLDASEKSLIEWGFLSGEMFANERAIERFRFLDDAGVVAKAGEVPVV